MALNAHLSDLLTSEYLGHSWWELGVASKCVRRLSMRDDRECGGSEWEKTS